MATLVEIQYLIDASDVKKAQAEFDKLTKEEQDALNVLKKFNDKLKETGDGAENAGKKLKDLGASGSLARLAYKAKQLRNEIELLGPSTEEFANKAKQLQTVEKQLNNIGKAAKGPQSGFQKLTDQLGPMGGIVGRAFAVGAIIQFGQAAITAAGKHQALMMQLKMVSGTTESATSQFIKLREQAKFMGLDFDTMSKSYAGFATASKFAGVSLSETDYQFKAVARAASAMSLSADDTQGVFLALQQMMSKGTVSAEELRGQLGERLSGAFTIFATSLGLTEKELNKMLETGSILSKDALPAFAMALNDAFAPQTLEALDLMNAKTANLSNSWTLFVETLGTTVTPVIGPMLDFVSFGLNKINQGIHSLTTSSKQLGEERLAKMESNVSINTEMELNRKVVELRMATGKAVTRAEAAKALLDASAKAYAATVAKADYEKKFTPNETNEARRNLQLANIRKAALDEEVARAAEAEKAKARMKESAAAAEEKKAKADADKAKREADRKQRELEQSIKKEYDTKLQSIEDTKKLAEIQLETVKRTNELDTDPHKKGAEESARIKLKIEETYLNEKLALNKKYNKELPKIIRDESKIIKAERDKVRKELKEGNDLLAILNDMPDASQSDADQRWKKAQKQIDEQTQKRIDKSYKARQEEIDLAKKVGDTEMETAATLELKRTTNEKQRKEIEENLKNSKIQAQIETNNQQIALNTEYYNSLNGLTTESAKDEIKQAKDKNAELIAQNKNLQAELSKDSNKGAEERRKIEEEAKKFTMQLVDMGFQMSKQAIADEITALNQKYDTEVEMADGNQAKINGINEKRRSEERKLKLQMFKADQMQSIAKVVFETAPIIASYLAKGITAPLAAIALMAQAAQIGFILSQKVPEYAEGTQGTPHEGGLAMVGEKGVEKVVTKSGKVYFTPPTATLVDLPKGAEVITNQQLKQEMFYANQFRQPTSTMRQDLVVDKLNEIGGILQNLPIHQVRMDEKGFQKYVHTPSRTTKILNNRFPNT